MTQLRTYFTPFIFFLLLIINPILTGCGSNSEQELSYQCPMLCEENKTYSEAGSCPVCKMDLEPLKN